MARRRRVEAPSADDLQKMEAELSITEKARPSIPIAQVAAQSAAASDPLSSDQRAEIARNRADAERLQMAEEAGLLLSEIGINEIDANAMVRDRSVLDEEDMGELRASIQASGLRMPLEVFELPEPRKGLRYGLLSGYRRLLACRFLAEHGYDEFRNVRCFIRQPSGVGNAYAAMVEENEVRASLSHFERGRVAVIAAQQGAFSSTEEAINLLFASASKAKRSKVRSFSVVFEELGDMLSFPEALTEKRGLMLASALRAGAANRFREALDFAAPADAEEEWKLLETVVGHLGEQPRDKSRGGRPKSKPGSAWTGAGEVRTASGFVIRWKSGKSGTDLRIEGGSLSTELEAALVEKISDLLEQVG